MGVLDPCLARIATFMVAPPLHVAAPYAPENLERALAGDVRAQHGLFTALMPHVQKRVNAVLKRRAGQRATRQEVLDLTQDVFVALFENDCKALRAWDPKKGAALPTWVGRIAEKRVISTLRTAKRNPWTETPTESTAIERMNGAVDSPYAAVARRDELSRLLDALQAELSEDAFALFIALYVEQRDVSVVADAHGLTANAVYIWRTRLKKKAREVRERLKDPPTAPRRGG